MSTNTIDKSENSNSENYSTIYQTTIKPWLYKHIYTDININQNDYINIQKTNDKNQYIDNNVIILHLIK